LNIENGDRICQTSNRRSEQDRRQDKNIFHAELNGRQ
jgi:hypothetical protein